MSQEVFLKVQREECCKPEITIAVSVSNHITLKLILYGNAFWIQHAAINSVLDMLQ